MEGVKEEKDELRVKIEDPIETYMKCLTNIKVIILANKIYTSRRRTQWKPQGK